MEHLSLEEILTSVNGVVVKKGNKNVFSGVSTDTRKIEGNDIFIALKGERFNGNLFVSEASSKGSSLCIVDEISFEIDEVNKDTTIIQVSNGKRALMDLAKYYRSKLNLKVVGITGSTGKTSTKDLTAAVLSSKLKVFKTIGNFNNEIGLPLMIFKLDNSYDAAVLEMGMSDFGEIHNLAEIARPDAALITNIGISHIENLKTRENILKAKLEITDYFEEDNTLIINADNDLLGKYACNKSVVIKIGTEGELNFKGTGIISNGECIKFTVEENNTEEQFAIPIPGIHNVLNSLLAIACGRCLGLNYEEIKTGIINFETTSMRLDIVKGEKLTIINDCYNASPDSMIAALDVLTQLEGKRKVAILGTMKELGDESYNAHYDIGKYAKENKIDLLITLGEFNNAYSKGFNHPTKHIALDSQEELFDNIHKLVEKNDVILVKASRSMKFENIVNKLEIINC